jgi:3-ketoacyl-CoA synthase
MALLALAIWYIKNQERPVYVIDFETWQPPESWRLTQEQLMTIMKNQGCFTQESLDFLERMLKQSGVGPKTAWPPGILKCLNGEKSDRSTEVSSSSSSSLTTTTTTTATT